MADDNDFEERPVRLAVCGPVAVLVAVCGVLLFWSDTGLATGDETEEEGLAAVTFIVGGMMKSRSGAT